MNDPTISIPTGVSGAEGANNNPSGNNTQGKKRGRPRIQPGEETCKNVSVWSNQRRILNLWLNYKKRKTQIRLAQQAYRERKESTIASLNDRIHHLEALVEQMGTTFLSLSEDLVKSGALTLAPDLAQTIQRSTKHFLSLTNQAVSIVDGGLGRVETESYLLPPDPTLHIRNAFVSAEAKGNLADGILPTHYSPLLSFHSHNTTTRESEESGLVNRLRLACLEVGYRCLTDPTSRPQTIDQRFGLPLGKVTRQRLSHILHTLLQNGLRVHSGDLEVPFFGIGGAGSHYIDYRRDYITENVIGRQRSIDATHQEFAHEMQDAWFDCYDVEGYLKERGIFPVNTSEHPAEARPYSASQSDNNGELREGQNCLTFAQKAQQHGTRARFVEERTLIQRKCPIIG
jgi:hypothetical protein